MEVYVIIATWHGVFDHAKVFAKLEAAIKYKEELEKATPNHMDYDVTPQGVTLEE